MVRVYEKRIVTKKEILKSRKGKPEIQVDIPRKQGVTTDPIQIEKIEERTEKRRQLRAKAVGKVRQTRQPIKRGTIKNRVHFTFDEKTKE